MAIKINNMTPVTQIPDTAPVEHGDGSFKFTLSSAIADASLQAKIDSLMTDISVQGELIARHMDIRDMKKYRGLIREFMNEVVYRSHKFSRENFLDRKGRHRVYGIIRLIDSNLDELAQEVNFNKTFFVKKFQQLFEMPPMKYVNFMRISRAKQLLLQTSLPITTIASRTGFQILHYFSRSFRSSEGVSPQEFRKTFGK